MSGTSASQGQPRFPAPGRGCTEHSASKASMSQPLSCLLHLLLLRLSCYHGFPKGLCLSRQPTFHGWERGRDPSDRIVVGAAEAPSPQGGEARDHSAQGILTTSSSIQWIIHPSAHCEEGEAVCTKAIQ